MLEQPFVNEQTSNVRIKICNLNFLSCRYGSKCNQKVLCACGINFFASLLLLLQSAHNRTNFVKNVSKTLFLEKVSDQEDAKGTRNAFFYNNIKEGLWGKNWPPRKKTHALTTGSSGKFYGICYIEWSEKSHYHSLHF